MIFDFLDNTILVIIVTVKIGHMASFFLNFL